MLKLISGNRTCIMCNKNSNLKNQICSSVFNRKFTKSAGLQAKTEVNGVKLNWRKVGDGPHTLLCLPGFLGTIETNWAPVWAKMNKTEFTLVGWDPPGYGKSRPPDREVFTEDNILKIDAHLVGQLMEKIGFSKYSVLGWSNGGVTAAYLASAFPAQVQKLILCNTPWQMSDRSVKVGQMLRYLENWPPASQKALLGIYERKYLDKMLKDFDKVTIIESKNMKYPDAFRSEVKTIQAPTLYIYGTKDVMVHESAPKVYKENISDFTFHQVPNAPHDHLEFLDELVPRVEEFLLTSSKTKNN